MAADAEDDIDHRLLGEEAKADGDAEQDRQSPWLCCFTSITQA